MLIKIKKNNKGIKKGSSIKCYEQYLDIVKKYLVKKRLNLIDWHNNILKIYTAIIIFKKNILKYWSLINFLKTE